MLVAHRMLVMKDQFTRRRVGTAIVIAILLAWLFWPDTQLASVRAMQQELFSEQGRTLSPEERQAKFIDLRTAMAKLSPVQRSKLGADRRQRMQSNLAKYFDMTPDEKKAYLDQQIDRGLQQQAQGANAGPGGSPGVMTASVSSSPEDRERRRQDWLAETTPETRAQMDIMRRDMAERRAERGLPPGRGGR